MTELSTRIPSGENTGHSALWS